MIYSEICLFNQERACPLKGEEVDGGLCEACAGELSREFTLEASRLTKASIISTLMVVYREKAKEIYKELMKAVDEW